MTIEEISIENYKSIKEITFPIKNYGSGSKRSNAALLIGINESGKSSILQGISLLKSGIEEVDYSEDCFIDAQEENEYIDIYAYLKFSDFEERKFIDKIKEATKWDEDDFKEFKIETIRKNAYCNSTNSGIHYYIELNDKFPIYKYVEYEKKVNKGGKVTKTTEYGLLSQVNSIKEEITKDNYIEHIKVGQKSLTKNKLESYCAKILFHRLNAYFPKIELWRSSKEFLLNDTIDLNEFKEDPKINIPLLNIFKIYGVSSSDAIKDLIEKSLKNQRKTDQLKEKLEQAVTKHINSIWKEHKIKFIVSINGSKCEVHVEDKDKKFNRFSMKQRSDGFQQFVSLILSLSVQNKTNELKNHLILIDEPEVHIHPSGIKYLRDELLKIGKNNNLIISTHSSFLVDTDVPERHWVVTKNKAETEINAITSETPLSDENVLKAAFGLSIFKEILPSNLLIVEGEDDKSIINHVNKVLGKPNNGSIKTAKGASKALTLASLLDDQKVGAHFLFDDDKEGRTFKVKIEKGFNKFFENKVFTLRDLVNTIPEKSTMEDLLPKPLVKKVLKRELGQTFTINNIHPVLKQAKDQNQLLRENKEKLESVKRKIAEEFISSFTTKAKMQNQCAELIKLANELEIKTR